MIDKLQVQHKIDQIELLQKELYEMLLNTHDQDEEIRDLSQTIDDLEDEKVDLENRINDLEEEITILKAKK